MTLEAKLILVAALFLFGLLTGAFGAYTYEHSAFIKYQATVEATAAAQQVVVDDLNKKVKDNSDASDQNLINSVDAIHSFYARYPNLVYRACTGAVPKAPGNPVGSNAASAVPDATTLYISPYTPESCELVAVQLDLLQKLLIQDGVTAR